jgi:hypothetical protein
MQYLITDKKEYEKVLFDLRKSILKPEYYNGTFINDKIMKAFDPTYKRPDVSAFKKEQAFSIEDFFA